MMKGETMPILDFKLPLFYAENLSLFRMVERV